MRNQKTIFIIITYNNGSTIKYCGHSNDRLDEEGTATVLEPTENDGAVKIYAQNCLQAPAE